MEVHTVTELEVRQQAQILRWTLLITISLCFVFLISYIARERYELVPWMVGPFLIPLLAFWFAQKKFSAERVSQIFIFHLFSVLVFERLVCAWDYLVDIMFLPSMITIAFFLLRGWARWIASFYLFFGLALSSLIVYLWQPFPIFYENSTLIGSVWIAAVATIAISLVLHGLYSMQIQEAMQYVLESNIEQRRLQELWSMLISTVVHDFGNSVTILESNLKLLERKGVDPRSLEPSKTATSRISKMIDNLRKLKVSFALKQRMDPEVLNLKDVLKTLPVLFADQLRTKDIHIEIFPLPADPAWVKTNPTSLVNHILANILSNAIKFCPPSGKVYFELIDDETQYRLSIKNQFVGSISSIRQTLESDSQTSTLGSSGETGQGLGLSIVRKFCQEDGLNFYLRLVDQANGPLVEAVLLIEKFKHDLPSTNDPEVPIKPPVTL